MGTPPQDGSGSGGSGPRQPDSSYRSPGLRGLNTTSLFRAVNPELFIRPVSEHTHTHTHTRTRTRTHTIASQNQLTCCRKMTANRNCNNNEIMILQSTTVVVLISAF